MLRSHLLRIGCAALLVLASSGCADGFRPNPSRAVEPASERTHTVTSPIAHVIFIIQENRSFDDLFQGYRGADTVASGKDSKGATIALVPIPLEATYDIAHGAGNFVSSSDGGRMDGFDQELIEGNAGQLAHPQYGYVPHSETKLYFEMARSYVLADRAYTSNIDASYVSHQYAIAGQANGAVDLPLYYGCDRDKSNVILTWTQAREYGPDEETCQNYLTLGDELDVAGLSWRYYTYSTANWLWTGYGSVRHIRYGSDWSRVVSPETKVLTDIGAGKLASVSWVTPSNPNSDHPGSESGIGPDWVASIVNAVGESPYWSSTAIFIMWDDWGGWYDHVPPPDEDYDGLGIRIPMLMISPYAKKNHVSHVQYETGSVLRFIEDRFGLAPLAASDARATDPAADCFDFNQQPRTFVPFQTKLRLQDFERADAASTKPPDSE